MSVAHVRVGVMRADNLIAFESRWPQHNGTKELAIRDQLGITPARYYQLAFRAVRTREGIEFDPLTARRVRDRLSVAV